jgi:hypothetical protein
MARIHRKSDSIETRMEDRLAKPDMELVAALNLRYRARGLTRIGRSTTARCFLLWIANLGLFEPGRRFEQSEMRGDCGRKCNRGYSAE